MKIRNIILFSNIFLISNPPKKRSSRAPSITRSRYQRSSSTSTIAIQPSMPHTCSACGSPLNNKSISFQSTDTEKSSQSTANSKLSESVAEMQRQITTLTTTMNDLSIKLQEKEEKSWILTSIDSIFYVSKYIRCIMFYQAIFNIIRNQLSKFQN